jgi:YrbI family 3-deoxy-D-manno-octulosonate 8-phosphate phosphatase
MQDLSVVLIGAGNVAWHLCKALSDNGMKPKYIHSKTAESAAELGEKHNIAHGNAKEQIPKANIYIFSVKDTALESLTQNQELKQKISNALCLHTAGSVPSDVFESLTKNYGVLYPLQTFSKNIPVNFRKIPICVEGHTKTNTKNIVQLASRLSSDVRILNSEERKKLHLAAVFACNFANHQTALAEALLDHFGIDFKILRPLIKETTRKALSQSARQSQTGPAVRNDVATLKRHTEILKELPYFQKIYTFVSSSIYRNQKNKFMDNFKERLKDIKAFVFDVDGVFSDLIILHSDGKLMRHMNVKDGFAVKTAAEAGYNIGIITGGDSESVRSRFEKLGVRNVYLESADKNKDFDDFLKINNLKAEDVLYMGDDIPDYSVMKRCALATCPADAVEEIQNISHYISDKPGGKGCVRDVIEQVMRAQGNWKSINGTN